MLREHLNVWIEAIRVGMLEWLGGYRSLAETPWMSMYIGDFWFLALVVA